MVQVLFRCASLFLTLFALSPLAARAQTTAPTTLTPPPAINAASSETHSGNGVTKFASGTGNLIYLGAGTLVPLLQNGPDGNTYALRTADSLLTSSLIAEGLKRIVREKRPDSDALTSFPSGHATAAFAVAAMQANYHPQQALLWYGGAALIAYSRVKLNRHRWRDVAAGMAVGYLTSRWELSRPQGLILSPFIKSRQKGGNGFSLSMGF